MKNAQAEPEQWEKKINTDRARNKLILSAPDD